MREKEKGSPNLLLVAMPSLGLPTTRLAHNGVVKRLQPLGQSEVNKIFPEGPKKFARARPNWLSLAALIMSWYLLSATSNNIAKIVLGHFPFPLTISLLHSLPATLSFLWIARSRGEEHSQQPQLTFRAFKRKWKWGLFLGFCSLCGGTFHRTSLMFVPVSFVHTIKACQPVFAVVVARLWLRETMPRLAYVALLPIVCGVGLAVCTEAEFNVIGFASAIASTFMLCLGNIGAKKLMTSHVSLDSSAAVNKDVLFHLTACYSSLVLSMVWLIVDAPKLFLSPTSSVFLHSNHVHLTVVLLIASAILSSLQNYVSLSVLSHVSSVSHSVATCFKRVFVITVALVYFGNPVSPWNAFGISISTIGVGLYQYAKKSVHKQQHSPVPRLNHTL